MLKKLKIFLEKLRDASLGPEWEVMLELEHRRKMARMSAGQRRRWPPVIGMFGEGSIPIGQEDEDGAGGKDDV